MTSLTKEQLEELDLIPVTGISVEVATNALKSLSRTKESKLYMKCYYVVNKEKVVQRAKKYYETHKEVIRKVDRELYAEDSTYRASRLLANSYSRRPHRRLLTPKVCKDCGMDDVESRIKYCAPIHVHHINGVHTDNRIENLKGLCASCHTKTHHQERAQRDQFIWSICLPMGAY